MRIRLIDIDVISNERRDMLDKDTAALIGPDNVMDVIGHGRSTGERQV